MKKPVSIDEIKNSYFGEFYKEVLNQKPKEQAQKSSLTSSANFILKETKRKINHVDKNQDKSKLSETQLLEIVGNIEKEEKEELSELERETVVASLSSSLQNYGILSPLLEQEDINDIIIRSHRDISVQKGRRNFQTDLSFSDEETYISFIENLLKRAGKSCTTATPVVDTAIDEKVRACVTHQSFSPPGSGPMLTLRISRHKDISLNNLSRLGLAPKEILNYLSQVVETGRNTILIAGEVGTGKTTLLKSLLSSTDESEAILIIEDTHELKINRKFVRTLLTRENNTEGRGKIAPALAIRTGMRMAMNRVVLGEMRDSEAAEAFIDVCSSGHSGLSTIHARSVRDSLNRLEIFLLRAQKNVGVSTVRRQISDSLSLILHIGLDPLNQTRRIMEVAEVENSSEGVVQISPIYKFMHSENNIAKWERAGGVSRLLSKNFSISEPGKIIELDNHLANKELNNA